MKKAAIFIYFFIFFGINSFCVEAPKVPGMSVNPLAFSVTGTDLFSQKKTLLVPEKKDALVVVFLSALCPCSNSHVSEIAALAKSYPQISFVGIHSNSNETLEMTQAYFKNLNLPFPILQDEGAKLANQFRALKTPHAFMILPSGAIAYQGGVSSSADFYRSKIQFLRSAIDDVENHRAVKIREGRTLGCIIKRG